VDKKISLDRKC